MKYVSLGSMALIAAMALAGSALAEEPAAKKDGDAKPKRPALAQLLKNADANGDQKLDLAEIHAKLPNFPEDRFKALDKNQDGFLEASEIPKPRTDAPAPGGGAGRGEMMEKMRAADSDGDQRLSQAEFAAAFPNAPSERFATMDRNQDGFVDRADRQTQDQPLAEKKKKDGTEKAVKKDGAEKKKKDSPAGKEGAAYVSRLIEKNDADKDGRLTLAELQTAKPGFPEKTFAALDRDKDGALTTSDAPERAE